METLTIVCVEGKWSAHYASTPLCADGPMLRAVMAFDAQKAELERRKTAFRTAFYDGEGDYKPLLSGFLSALGAK